MFAWGRIGVGGAGLAPAARRELGSEALAVACAGAGAAYGVVMNLHLWVTYSGDHSVAKLWTYFVTSLPFDLAHIVGNVLFCLVFGPALVRALARYRQRFEVTWRPAPALVASALAALVLAAPAPRPADAAAPPRAVNWLQGRRTRRRLRRRARPRSTAIFRSGAGLGFAAAGRNPLDVAAAAADIVAYLRATPRAAAPTSATRRARSCSCARPA